MANTDRQKAVDENFEAFKRLLPELLKKHSGKFAVLRDREVVEIFDTVRDAVVFANEKYEDGLFSIQPITTDSVDLGYYSHAMYYGHVRSGERSDLEDRVKKASFVNS